MTTHVPQGSSIHINCTAAGDQTSSWSIQPQGSTNPTQFDMANEALLNEHGYYETREDDSITHLFINSTQDINGTKIKCIERIGFPPPIIFETTLIVYHVYGRYLT